MNTLNAGGAEKALVNLLNELDYNRYDVDLFLMTKTGIFLDQVPADVTILSESEDYTIFSTRFSKSLLHFLRKGRFRQFLNKILFAISTKTTDNPILAEQRSWTYLKHFFPTLPKQYDVAIGYLEKNVNYFVIDCTKANRKIGYIHNDYISLGLLPQYDRPYFEKFDKVVSVSESCVASLDKVFPDMKQKFVCIENVNSPTMIDHLASVNVDVDLTDPPYLLSVGRLTEQKNFELAVDALKLLKDRGVTIKWIVIGEGPLKEKIEQRIEDNQLKDVFILLGLKANPYPYIKNALIYIQPSKFEGKSIAIDEAKILAKPIVVTDFPTAKDQIEDGKTGLISKMNANSLADTIQNLLENNELRETLQVNLKNEDSETELKMNRFYTLLKQL